MQSIHQTLETTRKPRVHITYDVETDGGVVKKELPFVVGVLGDFSKEGSGQLKPLRERHFITIDRDNFDEVMASQSPSVSMRVDNRLTQDDSTLNVTLHFNKLADFHPEQIIKQVPALNALQQTRARLQDLLAKSDCSVPLESALAEILQNNDALQALSAAIKKTEQVSDAATRSSSQGA